MKEALKEFFVKCILPIGLFAGSWVVAIYIAKFLLKLVGLE